MPKTMQAHVGTSGWTYDHWQGSFYPAACPKARRLEYYAGRFSTVELNATFYRVLPEATFANWYARTPPGFCWAVKANRFITHIKRLKDAREPLQRFLRCVAPLKEKLGPLLFQLPPGLSYDEEILEVFGRELPAGLKFALEARHRSWLAAKALQALKDHRIAWCISDTAGRYPYLEAVTAEFIYIRLHGSRTLYASEYTEQELCVWARKITAWGKEAYVYFDNDALAHAPRNAARLIELLQRSSRMTGA